MEKDTGINYNPTGLLFNNRLMAMMDDVTTKYIRDWMHTLASKGVLSTHLVCIVRALHENDVSFVILQTYTSKFILPRSRGYRPSDLYFSDAMLGSMHVKQFASDCLGMTAIMNTFLQDKLAPRGKMLENIACFKLMFKIVCTLRRGTIDDNIAKSLESTIVDHAVAFLKLYGEACAKIKFHHLFDLVWCMHRIRHSISCFAPERKNKDALAVCSQTDKAIERESIVKYLNAQLNFWQEHDHVCEKQYLHRPRIHLLPSTKVMTSTSATLACGDVFAGDRVALTSGDVGKVIEFYQHDAHMFTYVAIHRKKSEIYFELAPSTFSMIEVDCIVEPVCYYEHKASNKLVVSMPEYCE